MIISKDWHNVYIFSIYFVLYIKCYPNYVQSCNPLCCQLQSSYKGQKSLDIMVLDYDYLETIPGFNVLYSLEIALTKSTLSYSSGSEPSL